jgi:hypothetical protein
MITIINGIKTLPAGAWPDTTEKIELEVRVIYLVQTQTVASLGWGVALGSNLRHCKKMKGKM